MTLPEQYTYLAVDLGCILVPFLFSFHPRIKFHLAWKQAAAPVLLTALFFLVWDVFYTRAGVWWFDRRYVVGIYLFDLPLEEYLFFFCIPYACVFSWYCFRGLKALQMNRSFVRIFYGALTLFLAAFALKYYDRAYTVLTFALCAAMLAFLLLKNTTWLGNFFWCYWFIMIFFVLSNGVLTGSFFDRTVVHYNDAENLGVRMLTIPFEDIFYGMLLMLASVAGFERNLAKANARI